MTGVEALNEELRGLDREIEAAAVAGDAEGFVRLSMRRAALPSLILAAKASPLRAEVERLERELEELEIEAEKVLESPAPEVPRGRRGHLTPGMVKNARIGEARARQGAVVRQLEARRRRLAEIEQEGAAPL